MLYWKYSLNSWIIQDFKVGRKFMQSHTEQQSRIANWSLKGGKKETFFSQYIFASVEKILLADIQYSTDVTKRKKKWRNSTFYANAFLTLENATFGPVLVKRIFFGAIIINYVLLLSLRLFLLYFEAEIISKIGSSNKNKVRKIWFLKSSINSYSQTTPLSFKYICNYSQFCQ